MRLASLLFPREGSFLGGDGEFGRCPNGKHGLDTFDRGLASKWRVRSDFADAVARRIAVLARITADPFFSLFFVGKMKVSHHFASSMRRGTGRKPSTRGCSNQSRCFNWAVAVLMR